jgi:hypothetical protein
VANAKNNGVLLIGKFLHSGGPRGAGVRMSLDLAARAGALDRGDLQIGAISVAGQVAKHLSGRGEGHKALL